MNSKKLRRLAALFMIIVLTAPCFAAGGMGAEMTEPAAEGAYVFETQTGTVVYSKNETARLYPASTTKLMTAIVALEVIASDQTKSLEDKITFSHDAIYGIPRDTMHISLQEGEEITVRQTLYAMMLPSANEACLGMAEYIAGSVTDFVALMNQKAAELGLENTHFVNPNGLHDDDHYTCPKDLAKILWCAVSNDTLREIMSTQTYTIPATNKTADKRVLTTTDKLILSGNQYYDSRVVCGKTGYTTPAGNTLATYSEVGGMKLITVVMKAGQGVIFTATSAILDWCENNLEFALQSDVFGYAKSVSTPDGGKIYAQPEGVLSAVVRKGGSIADCRAVYSLPESVSGQVNLGDALGTLELYIGEIKVGSARLVARTSWGLETSGPAETSASTLSTVTAPPSGAGEGKKAGSVIKTFLVALAAILLLCGIVYAAVFCGSLYLYGKRRRTRGKPELPDFMKGENNGTDMTDNERRKK